MTNTTTPKPKADTGPAQCAHGRCSTPRPCPADSRCTHCVRTCPDRRP
jgi:hypothetical protein